MLGIDIEEGSETEADAVCEVLNLIGGNACTRIEQIGILLRPEPPVWSGSGEIVSPTEKVVRAVVVSAEETFDVGCCSWPFRRGGQGGENPVQHDAQGIEVGPPVTGLTSQELGGQILLRAAELMGGRAVPAEGAGAAEIDHDQPDIVADGAIQCGDLAVACRGLALG